jgi:DNA-binding beta-propeller fold protein YncE
MNPMRWFTLSVLLLAPSSAIAQTGDLTYWQDIRPIFRKHCTACHSAKHVRSVDVSGGLALDTYEATKKGSKQSVYTAGQSAKSPLHELLVTKDVKRRMPLDGDPLSKEKIDLIKKWIDTGAKEGTPPMEVAVVPAKKAATRKLDVLLPISATPPKAKGKLELALKVGPLAPVTAVAFSPDGKLLAVGSYGQVAVWDLDKAQPAKVLTNVLGAINDLKFSPNGDILAVGGGQPSAKGDLRLYQVSDWKLLATLRGHDDVVFSLAFSPDGKQLASASFDHSVRLWDVQSHATIKEYHHHSDFIYAVAFHPNGKQLVSASKDRTVQLFDVQSGKSAFTFSGMNEDVMAVAFHPDGKSVISSGFETAIYWWNAQTGEKIKTQGGHGVAVHELAFSKDGKLAVSAGADRTVRVWDGTAGTAVKVIPVGSVTYALAISPSGKLIASGSFDGLVRVWDVASARQLGTLLAIAGDEQSDWLALTPEGYANVNDKLAGHARWRVNAADAPPLWSSLRQPPIVARALRGEVVPTPKFDK